MFYTCCLRYRSLLCLPLLFSQLTACSLWQPATDTPSVTSLSAYAEAVFRRQNSAISKVMMLGLDEDESPAYERILAAEKSVQTACAALNDYAELAQDGENTGLLLSARAGKSLQACDAATTELERLLRPLPSLPHNACLPPCNPKQP